MKFLLGASFSDEVSEREKQNDELAYRAALESIVLLRNDGCLPLKQKEVSLFGAGANHTIKGGTGSGEVNNRHSVSIYEGLLNCGVYVASRDWIEGYDRFRKEEHEAWIREHRAFPSAALLGLAFEPPVGRPLALSDFPTESGETAIYVVSRRASEGYEQKLDNGDFNLKPHELADIRLLYKHFHHLIVVINSGSVMDLSELDDLNISLIYLGYAGQQGGNALAALLTGKESFSGKLADTWMKKYSDVPFGNEFSYLSDKGNEYYREGIYVGYRYYDSFGVEPRFHFGYGLTYSSFAIRFLDIKQADEKINVSCSVRNTGVYKGKETVQLYVSCPQGKLKKEYQRLVAFAKTKELQPGEEERIDLCFELSGCASFDEFVSSFILEKGNYLVRLGNSSAAPAPCARFVIPRNIVVSEHDSIMTGDEPFEQMQSELPTEAVDPSLLEIVIDADRLKKKTFAYGKPTISSDDKIKKILDGLSEKELIQVCVGVGGMTMFDHDGIFVPGQVGKTTTKLMKKGIKPTVLADGPAGLRLVKKSAISKKGALRFYKDNYLVAFMELMPPYLQKLFSPRKNDLTVYQFATAFPAGSCLSQCWNETLVEEVGYAVSKEMREYNVTFWLAPGMNIHRNPLCGRNFEYYSEDPLLTGKISAAMTRGVQRIKGNYTVIKHFCCNNASEDSNKSNSHVSERALREIYLKGFEINIKEGGSRSVMTSYNKVNGTHASDSYDLCTKVLRNEWGFDGVVMTDWTATDPKQDVGHSDLAVSAGNDLMMPGGKQYQKAIQKGLENGTVSKEDLQRAAANIIRLILDANVEWEDAV